MEKIIETCGSCNSFEARRDAAPFGWCNKLGVTYSFRVVTRSDMKACNGYEAKTLEAKNCSNCASFIAKTDAVGWCDPPLKWWQRLLIWLRLSRRATIVVAVDSLCDNWRRGLNDIFQIQIHT